MNLSMVNDAANQSKAFIIYTIGGARFTIDPGQVLGQATNQLHWKNPEGEHWVDTDKIVAVSMLDVPG